MNERLVLPRPARAGVRRIVWLCALVAFGLALFELGERSFWQDEGFTWSTVDRPFGALVALLVRDEAYQMLHSLILWPVAQGFHSEAPFRLPSVLAFAALVPAAFIAGRRLFDDRAGVVAAALLAVHGFLLEYAQEARSYALATTLVTAAGAALAGAVADPSRRRRHWWIAWSALAIWAHGFAVLAIAAQVASTALLPDPARHPLRPLRSAASIGVLALPAIVLPPLQVSGGDVWFITRPDLGSVLGFGWFAAGRTATTLPVYALAVVVATAIVVAAAVRGGLRSIEVWRHVMPLAWFAGPPLVLMAASIVGDPIWISRYATWSVPAAAILVGGITVRFVSSTRAVALVGIVLVLLAARGAVKWFETPMREDYRSAAHALADGLAPGDVVIFTPDETRIPTEFYLDRGSIPDGVVPAFPRAAWGTWGTGDHATVDVTAAEVEAAAEGAQRIWVVQFGDDAVNEPRLARLDDDFRVRSLRIFRGPIVLIGYERR